MLHRMSSTRGGRGEMTKAPITLQDLRRRLYVKAKAEPSWRFWGLYGHVCKDETLRAAYELAKHNDGAPGVVAPAGDAERVGSARRSARRREHSPNAKGNFGRHRVHRSGPAAENRYRPAALMERGCSGESRSCHRRRVPPSRLGVQCAGAQGRPVSQRPGAVAPGAADCDRCH